MLGDYVTPDCSNELIYIESIYIHIYFTYIFSQKQNEFVCLVGALEVSPLPRS